MASLNIPGSESLNISAAFDSHHIPDAQRRDRLLQKGKEALLINWGFPSCANAEFAAEQKPGFGQALGNYKQSIHDGERPVAAIEKMHRLGLDTIEQLGVGEQTKQMLKDKAINLLDEAKEEAPGSTSQFLKVAEALEIFACYNLQNKLMRINDGRVRRMESPEGVQKKLVKAIHVLETFSRHVAIQSDVSMMHSEIEKLINGLALDCLTEEEYQVFNPWIKQALDMLKETNQERPSVVEKEVAHLQVYEDDEIVEIEEEVQSSPQSVENIENLMKFFPEDRCGRRDQEKIQDLLKLESNSNLSPQDMQVFLRNQAIRLLRAAKPNRILHTSPREAYAALNALEAFCLYMTHSENMLSHDNSEKTGSHIRKSIKAIEDLKEDLFLLSKRELKPMIKNLSHRMQTILAEDLTLAEQRDFNSRVDRVLKTVKKF